MISKHAVDCYYNNVNEFNVGGTYICTTAHYMHYKIFYSNTIFYSLGI